MHRRNRRNRRDRRARRDRPLLARLSTTLGLSLLSSACGASDEGSPGFGSGGAPPAEDSDAPAGDGADDAGTGGDPDAPPPEMEEEGNFRVPRASGRFVYSASETTDSVAVIDSVTLAIDVVGVGRGPTVVATFSEEGAVAVLDQGSDDVALLRTNDAGQTTVEVVPSSPGANNLAVSPDGRLVYVYHDVDGPQEQGAGSDQEITVIDVEGGQVYEMTVGVHPRDVVFAADGSITYVVTDDGVNVVPTADLPMIGKPDLVPVVDDPAIDPSTLEIQVAADQGTALARIEGDDRLFATDLSTGDRFDLPLPGLATDLDIARDGSFAIVTMPSLQGSRFAQLPLPVSPGDTPDLFDVDGEYVGLAHLSPDGTSMLLYTTVDPFMAAPEDPGDAWLDPSEPRAGGSASSGTGTGTTGETGESSSDGGASGDDNGGDTADVPPGQDPRQRVTIARRGSGSWSERITLLVDHPVRSVGMAPDGANAMLMHTEAPAQGTTPWSYTLLDLSKEFPVKKLQRIEAEPRSVLFSPEGDRSVVLIRDDAVGVQRVDLVDLRSFIVDALGLGSPPEGAGYVDATEKIFVSQEHPTGRITFLDREGNVETVTGYRLNDAVKD
ncbi:MAG: YncE family protein [Myxococcota bacterium]